MKTAKDMHKVYASTSTIDLLKNRSKKVVQMQNLTGVGGYWARKERARLRDMIMQIDAVLAARAAREPLF